MGGKQSKQKKQEEAQSQVDQAQAQADYSEHDTKLKQGKLVLLSDRRADPNLPTIIFTYLGRLDFLHASQCSHAMRKIGEMKQSRKAATVATSKKYNQESIEDDNNNGAPMTSEYSFIISELFSEDLQCPRHCFVTPSTVDLRIDFTVKEFGIHKKEKMMDELLTNPLLKFITSVHLVANQTAPSMTSNVISQRINLNISKLPGFSHLRMLYVNMNTAAEALDEFNLILELKSIAPQLHVLKFVHINRDGFEPNLSILLPHLKQLRILALAVPPGNGVLLHLTLLEALLFHNPYWSTSHEKEFINDIRTLTLKHRLRSLSVPTFEAILLDRLIFDTHQDDDDDNEYEKMQKKIQATLTTSEESIIIEEYESRYPIEPPNLTRLVVGMQSRTTMRVIHRIPSLTSLEHLQLADKPLILTSKLQQGLRELRLTVREGPGRFGVSGFDLPELPLLQVLHLTIANELDSYRMSKVDMTMIFSHVPSITELHLSVFPLTFAPLAQCCPLIRTMKLTVHEPLSDGQRDDDLFSTLSQLTHFTTLELRFSRKYRMIMAAAAVLAAKKLNPEMDTLQSDYSTLPFLLSPYFHHAFISSSSWCVLRLSVEQFRRGELQDRWGSPPSWKPKEIDAYVPTWKGMLQKQPDERIKSQVQRFRIYYHRTEDENDYQCYGLVPLKGAASSSARIEASVSATPTTTSPSSASPAPDSSRYGWRQHLLIV